MLDTYKYYLDEKVEVWIRSTFTVQAASKEDADALVKAGGFDEFKDYDMDGEVLFDTIEPVQHEPNEWPTKEIIDEEGQIIINSWK